jgi:hypothetical protein
VSALTLGKVHKYSAKPRFAAAEHKAERTGTALAVTTSQRGRNVPKRDNSAGSRLSDVEQWSTTADLG